MPLYFYSCTHCGREISKILKPEESKLEFSCPRDGHALARVPKGPSTSTKEVIDNGIQPRKVEQYADSAELLEEREANQRAKKNKNDL